MIFKCDENELALATAVERRPSRTPTQICHASVVATRTPPAQAAARLALKTQREAEASLEAERRRLEEEREQHVRRLREAHLAEVESLRAEANRSAREAAAAARASLEAAKRRLADEREEDLRRLREAHLAEKEALRAEAERAAGEAAARLASEKEEAVAAAASAADERLFAAAEEADGLRKRLESVPGEVRADLEREFGERERLAREEVRIEVSEHFLARLAIR